MARFLGYLRRRAIERDELTVCPHCRCDFVSPTTWAEQDDRQWWIQLRCGECGEGRDVVVPDAAAQRFDLALDRGAAVIAATLRRLERERMTADVEAFAVALRLDLYDAGDFA